MILVSKLQANLAAFIKGKNISLPDIVHRSRGQLKYATAHAILSEKSKNIGIETLISLAKGLGVSIYEVVGAAVGDEENPVIRDFVANSVLDKFSKLEPHEKKELMPYLKVLESQINELPKPLQKLKKAS